MMGCDEACAAGFDLVFIGLPLLSLYDDMVHLASIPLETK